MTGAPIVMFSCGLLLLVPLADAQPVSTPQAAEASAPHRAIPLDAQAMDRYAGYYSTGPQRAVRFWREGEHFYFGAVGTPQRTEAFPETPTRFFFANPAVTFTFNVGSDGTVSTLTINQAGRDIAAPRIAEDVAKTFTMGSAGAMKPTDSRTWPLLSGVAPKEITSPDSGVMDYWPCFSPDGKTVLFSRTPDGGKTWALFRVPTGGGAAVPFVKLSVSATRASWSTKSGRIIFNGEASGGKAGGLWMVDGDGRNAHVIPTPGILAPAYPSWYPDEKAIAFGDAARNILYRMELEGGSPAPLTQQDRVLTGMASVSPDGNWIAFAGQANARAGL